MKRRRQCVIWNKNIYYIKTQISLNIKNKNLNNNIIYR